MTGTNPQTKLMANWRGLSPGSALAGTARIAALQECPRGQGDACSLTKSTMAAATSLCIVSLRMSWRPPGTP